MCYIQSIDIYNLCNKKRYETSETFSRLEYNRILITFKRGLFSILKNLKYLRDFMYIHLYECIKCNTFKQVTFIVQKLYTCAYIRRSKAELVSRVNEPWIVQKR